MSTRQICARTKVPSRNLRKYCRYGIVRSVKHNRAGRRLFSAAQLELVALLYDLERTGLTMSQLKQYQNVKSPAIRKALLSTQKRQLWQEITERQRSIDFIERQEELLGQEHGSR